MWGVYYVGAPYGINERGELISRHRTAEAAHEARLKLQDNPKYHGSNTVVKEIEKK